MSTAVMDAVPVLAPGTVIVPGHTVLEHVSRGGALDVYEVFSADLMCSAMAKTVRPDRAGVRRVRERLLTEGRLLTSLNHPHLPRGYSVHRTPVPTVVLETIEGPDLEEVVDTRSRRLPATDIAHLGRHLCSALHHLHAAGYLHLDVRPANVVNRAGTAVLIDLSIARRPGRVRRGTGTAGYLSPEQARGGHVSVATDVWGLGATLFEAATGEPPFPDAPELEQLHRPAVAPRSLRPRLDVRLETVIAHCLSPEPSARPSVVEVHEQLGALSGQQPQPMRPMTSTVRAHASESG